MLERISDIQGIGLLHQANGKPHTCHRATLIYADNGRGKSTLATTIRSVSTGNAALISAYRTIDGTLPPKVVLQFGSGHKVNFVNGGWSEKRPEILVFDAEFIGRNVHSGGAVSTDHRKNLLEFALGEAAVAARTEVDAATTTSKVASDLVTGLIGQLSGHHPGMLLPQFEKLPDEPDIDTKVGELNKRILAASNVAAIQVKQIPKAATEPSFDLDGLFAGLALSLKDVHADAEQIVKQHVAKLGGKGAEGWLSQGLHFGAGLSCPFCDQDVSSSQLVSAYQTHFNAAYASLKSTVAGLQEKVAAGMADSVIDSIGRSVNVAAAQATAWTEHVQTENINFDIGTATASLKVLREFLLELTRKKQSEPLEALGSAGDKTKAVGLWAQVLAPIREVNVAIQMAEGQISTYKKQLDGENAAQLQQQVLRLQAIKRRYDPQVANLLVQLATARTGVNSADKTKKVARESLDSLMTSTLARYLAGLPDLVLLMDESHRYRASAGVRAINELRPLMGLELTATPFVESTSSSKKPVPFKNVVMDYPLARAMDDGFVKDPAVVTQRNFDAKNMPPEEVERVKLQDGVRMHEATKVELKTYARTNGVKEVKPFMLVIARDTTHAGALLALVQSDAFFSGRYAHKVIQVDSSKSGADEEEMIRRLLAVESVSEPTEIVIHVNMLKEGWDVTNLYTIVPLRAANARTLVEQSIGRGLRLPYGKRTGVDAVDRLNIIAHDRFQDIIDDANRADSPIKLKTLILEAPDAAGDGMQSLTVASNLAQALGLNQQGNAPEPADGATQAAASGAATPVFSTAHERQAAAVVMQVLAEYELRPGDAPSRQALLSPELQARMTEAVKEKLPPVQPSVLVGADAPPELDVADVVRRTVEEAVKQTIDIPRIVVVPKGVVTSGFKPFTLDVAGLHLQPKDRSLVGQALRTHAQFTLSAQSGKPMQRPEDYIVHALSEFDDVDYTSHASLLYDLSGQMVAHLQSYLSEESEVRNVLDLDRQLIAKNIHAQMMSHFHESATEYAVEVRRGFTALKEPTYTVGAGQPVRDHRHTVDEPSRIKQMVFGHFSRCLYLLQKFDSDTERRFAVILERDADKWFKPAKGQFQVFYKLGVEQPEYVPDFVAETAHFLLIAETKARNELGTEEVKAKAEAGALWCQHASDHAKKIGAKPWKYLLIPHDLVTEDKRLVDFLSFAVEAR